MNLFVQSSAVFSPCDKYRYVLERIWGDGGRLLLFLLLNPSTATADKNDPTVERQCRRARMLGYDGIIVVNLFAWRRTDPNALLLVDDPIGPNNDVHILYQALRASLVICGWGSHKAAGKRGGFVLCMLRENGIAPHALKVTGGRPWHPLYLSYSLTPFLMEVAA